MEDKIKQGEPGMFTNIKGKDMEDNSLTKECEYKYTNEYNIHLNLASSSGDSYVRIEIEEPELKAATFVITKDKIHDLIQALQAFLTKNLIEYAEGEV